LIERNKKRFGQSSVAQYGVDYPAQGVELAAGNKRARRANNLKCAPAGLQGFGRETAVMFELNRFAQAQ